MRRRSKARYSPTAPVVLLTIPIILFLTVATTAQSPARPANLIRVRPLTVGERLVYNVAWSDIPAAGRLELEVMSRGPFFGREGFQLRTRVQTLNQAWALFGEIDNQYTSYIDAASARPHRLVTSRRQGSGQRQTADELTIIDESGEAVFPSGRRMSLPTETFDLPALLTALRRQPLPESGRKRYHVLVEQQLVELDAEAVGRRKIATPAGTFDAVGIRLMPRQSTRYRATIWLTADENRTPLTITAVIPLGELRAELIGATLARLPQAAPLTPPGDEAGRYPFTIGERLSYDISWSNFLNVGRASFEVRQRGVLNGQPVLEFYGEATSIGAARALLTVNDQLSSLVLADRLIPLRSEIRLREGRRTKIDTAIFNHANQTATLTNGTAFRVEPETLDLLSFFYKLRTTVINPGENRRFALLDANHRPRSITVRGLKKEPLAGPTGTLETVMIEIIGPENNILATGWISTSSARLPILFTARTTFGTIQFRLVSALDSATTR